MEDSQSAISEQIGLAQRGSLEAFEKIVRDNQRIVRVFIARQIEDVQTVDDLAQEVFVAAFRNIKRFRGESSITSWLMGIARHRVIDHVRSLERHRSQISRLAVSLDDLRLAELEQTEPDSESEYAKVVALRNCVRSLIAEHQELIKRFYYDGESADAISRDYGRPAGTIRMMLLRIRRALRSCVERKLEAEGSEL